jgi:hypothetical protein
MSYPYIVQTTTGEPLASPWYTPGFTSQNPDYQVVPVNPFEIAGFPLNAVYVNVSANYFDEDGNPVGGYLTFWPSSLVTMTSDSVTTVIPQRRVGTNLYDQGSYFGSGKMFFSNGRALVQLLATDNVTVNLSPPAFTYHVIEHFLGGREYDISVPSTSISPVDINSLIIPGSVTGAGQDDNQVNSISFSVLSTEQVAVDITAMTGGESSNPTSSTVQFAFINGPSNPQSDDWKTGSWASVNAPYIAEILVGPDNGGLALATGSYMIWVKIIATPQVPVFHVGTLRIF